MQTYKIKTTDYLEFKRKRFARVCVTKALRSGELKRAEECDICKQCVRTNAHHIDYGKPLSVMWVCDKCHGKCHVEDSPLNPKNNVQTNTAMTLNSNDMVTVSVNIPMKNFMVLKQKSIETKKKVSSILRNNIIKEYAIESAQLEFNFDEVINDKAPHVHNENLLSVGENESLVLQQERSSLSLIRREGDNSLREMEKEFSLFSGGYGGNASELQFACEAR